MYTVTVDFIIKPEHAEDFHRTILEHAKTSLAEDRGCRRFDVVVAVDNRCHVFLYELYDDVSAFKDHGAAPHTKKVSAMVTPWLVSKNLLCFEPLALG